MFGDSVMLAANGTQEGMPFTILIFRCFAPFVLDDLTIFHLAFTAFGDFTAFYGIAAMSFDGVESTAGLTLVCMTLIIFILPGGTEIMGQKCAVFLITVLADCQLGAGGFTAAVLGFGKHAPGADIGNLCGALGILKVSAAFGTVVIGFFTGTLAGGLYGIHSDGRAFMLLGFGEGVEQADLPAVSGGHILHPLAV